MIEKSELMFILGIWLLWSRGFRIWWSRKGWANL